MSLSTSLLFLTLLSITVGQEVPGIEQWRQQVKQVIKAERKLEKEATGLKDPSVPTTVTERPSEEEEKIEKNTTKKSTSTSSNVDPSKFKDLLQTVIKRFLSKVEKKKENKAFSTEENISSKLLSLLSQSKKSKTKKTNNSYLDKLLQTYESKNDYENFIRRNEYDSGLLSQFDDTDILSEYLERPRFSGRSFSTFDLYDDPYSTLSRPRSIYDGDINEALLESRLLDRELRGLLRRIDE